MEKLIFNLCLPNEAFVDNWHQVDTKTIQMTSLYSTMLVTLKIIRQYKSGMIVCNTLSVFQTYYGCILCEWSSIRQVWGMNYSDDTFSRHCLSVVWQIKLDLKQQQVLFDHWALTPGVIQLISFVCWSLQYVLLLLTKMYSRSSYSNQNWPWQSIPLAGPWWW